MDSASAATRIEQPPIDIGRGFVVREATARDFADARANIVRVLEEDLGTGYLPEMHWDLDDMQGTYVDNPRQALFVAVDEATGRAIGTIAVRTDGPKSPPHPKWLADRYAPATVAQVFRAYIAREHRRRGVASALVEAARRFIRDEGGYETIYLHTNPSVPGAEPFWRAMPTREIFDSRRDEGAPGTNALHFELEMLAPGDDPPGRDRSRSATVG
jgi:GNAT superfamily N-acetyltransferase